MKSVLEKAKYVKVMADHCATGLWDIDSKVADIKLVSDNIELIQRIKVWQENFDKTDPFTQLTQEEDALHINEGLEIAKQIKQEHPHWRVVLEHKGLIKGNLDKKGYLIVDESLMTA